MLPGEHDGLPFGASRGFAGAAMANTLVMLGKASGNEAFGPIVRLHAKTP